MKETKTKTNIKKKNWISIAGDMKIRTKKNPKVKAKKCYRDNDDNNDHNLNKPPNSKH